MRSRKHRNILLLSALTLTALLLTACNFPGVQSNPPGNQEDTVATQAAQTVAAELTQSGEGDGTASDTTDPNITPTITPEPATDTPAPPTNTPEPTACRDAADFVTDVTVPDDTRFSAGEDFTKTWRLENAGTCTWTTGYELAFDRGDQLNAPSSLPLPGRVQPGEQIDLSVDMTSPAGNGTFQGYWKLRNEDDVLFGIGDDADVAFWVRIVVGPTATPAPEVYMTKKGTLSSSYLVDLDEGDFSPSSSTRDLWYEAVTPTERYFTPRNGATIAVWDSGTPSYEDCEGAGLSGDRISFDDFSEGDWICFETNEGRLGRLELENIESGDNPDVRIDIRTWE